jgi:hypothetical protein
VFVNDDAEARSRRERHTAIICRSIVIAMIIAGAALVVVAVTFAALYATEL